MSVLIKGMEMPKNGEMKKIIIGRAPNGIDPIAIVTGDNTEFYKIIEVPTPHGDLVDRDDLIDEINRVTFVKRYDYNVAYNIVTDAETIIEAEVSEG